MRRATGSAIFAAAAAEWRAVRAEFEGYREAAFAAAHDACNGNLVNARGRAAGVTGWSLFIGSTDRAYLYATDELRDHWRTRPRMTWAEFERQHVEGRRPRD